jgi:hypothetical protein
MRSLLLFLFLLCSYHETSVLRLVTTSSSRVCVCVLVCLCLCIVIWLPGQRYLNLLSSWYKVSCLTFHYQQLPYARLSPRFRWQDSLLFFSLPYRCVTPPVPVTENKSMQIL